MGNNSVPKFIFRLSRFPVYRGSVLGRFYCTTFFITVNALHVSGGFTAHHQELKNCTHSMGYVSSLLAATASGRNKQPSHIPDPVCTVLSSWWWAQKPPETCRALTVIKNTVECCILLIYLKEYINDARSHEHQICWAHITKFSATIFMLLTLARLLPSLWFFQYSSCPLEVGTHR